jgi:hypothetical protein
MDFESRFRDLLDEKTVDWDAVEVLLDEVGESINDMVDDEETLLSQLFYGIKGAHLAELLRRFLRHGYDVNANDGKNGCFCIANLSYAGTFDGDEYDDCDADILTVAKMILDAGYDVAREVERDGDVGTGRQQLTFSGNWITGYYRHANLLSCLHEMLGVAENHEDYHGYYDVGICLGQTLSEVTLLGGGEPQGETSFDFRDALVFRFGQYPLVVDRYAEFFTDPNRSARAMKKKDITEFFRDIVGRKLTDFRYLSKSSAEMVFDNGTILTLTNDADVRSLKNVTATLKIN